MKLIFLILLFVNILFGDTLKVYFYTTEANINNYKSLKVSFDAYLRDHGDYEFQPFNDKKTFEKYLKDKNSIVILSSWHYKKIAKEYNLEAKLVAQKKDTFTDTKILVGQKNISLNGVVASAYDNEYANELLITLANNKSNKLSILIVPKEIDALMSVGFGMSQFALVSKDSFKLLKEINPLLSKSLQIYHESEPKYRMLLTCSEIDNQKNELVSVFQEMGFTESGKSILKMIGVDKLVVLSSNDLENLGGLK
ncbi:hypothetical protein SMGD1_1738 [Sulfurimonas gotlandica GD1]|uniref:Uncharacterized protein n=1 Tax=Sulfurimonas gotlandica (strain DSM 19862 / JCM 16533 / GD1) TaxID=929558 RepID=B6BIB0_SULGG|nr:hypothetical protein [Sulfurimonas gotlandica]EDZ62898.1 conserved hypothetical protein [Sulfurimonas gotlandica GD1]EHP30261.1 hypothetical protein SMGD1_1738 [Sulfurimonas gotlandica GD1]